MVKRLAIALLLLGSMIAWSFPANAGGWASVRVVSQEVNPDNARAWTITVVVLQHDVSPSDADEVTAHFVNTETGETLDVTGVATGAPGEFRFDVEFPEGGSWNWSATPAPYPTVNMAALNVGGLADSAVGAVLEGTIWRGDCQNLGTMIESFPMIRSVHTQGAIVDTGVVSAYDVVLDQATEGRFAITVTGDAAGEAVKKCREARALDGIVPISVPELVPADGASTESWTLLPNGDGSAATLVAVIQPAVKSLIVEITESGGGAFNPPSVTVPAGTTVTWVNKTAIAHTVSGLDPTFANSGMLDPGQVFSQTFTTPGTFHYACDPHSWMTGTVTVTES